MHNTTVGYFMRPQNGKRPNVTPQKQGSGKDFLLNNDAITFLKHPLSGQVFFILLTDEKSEVTGH